MTKVKIFYSYSHRDEEYREHLETHLSVLRKNGLIDEWHDRRISAGRDWEEDINLNLNEADIILLLVSSHFLASDYCYDTETIRALERHDRKECVVIPILVRPCLWRESKLKTLQALPRDNKAISSWPNQDEAWVTVASGILEVVKGITAKPERKPQASVEQSGTLASGVDLPDLVMRFLTAFQAWYFSPLRIQKWGGRQPGFETLKTVTAKEISSCLVDLHRSGRVKTTVSQKGNTIYKAA